MAIYLKPGMLLGRRYRLGEILGAGAFGVVHTATQEVFGTPERPGLTFRTVALKIFTDKFVNPENVNEVFREAIQVERFYSEARTRGEEPHLVEVYDIGIFEEQWAPYVAMELVNGGSLASLLRKQCPALVDCVGMLRQICSAMKGPHARGVYHRDLKPDNVLFTKNGLLKVADFGLAINRIEAFRQNGQAGTVAYAPPENGLVSGAFDVYSMGVMLLEFILGDNPLYGVLEKKRALYQAQEQLAELRDPRTGELLVHLNLELRKDSSMQEILRRCLAMEAPIRFRNATELDKALQDWQGGRKPHAPPLPSRSCEEILREASRLRTSGQFASARAQMMEAQRRCREGSPDLLVEWSKLHEAFGDLGAAIEKQNQALIHGRTKDAILRLADLENKNHNRLAAMALEEEARNTA